MNQIIGAVMLFGIITVVFAPLIVESGSQIFSKSASISDSMELSRIRSGQILVATNVQQDGGFITIYLSNIGIEDVTFHTILIDGVETAFLFKNQDSIPVDVFSAGELGVLEVTGVGHTVQAVTTTGKLFEFFVE